jgi:hypothetical protein
MNIFHFSGGMRVLNSPPPTHFLFTILTCAHRMRVHFCPQHWLLCHLVRVEQATLELRCTNASDGVPPVVVALRVEQATLALRSTNASDGVASVAVALRVEQASGTRAVDNNREESSGRPELSSRLLSTSRTPGKHFLK